jgi:RES domain-containing protein
VQAFRLVDAAYAGSALTGAGARQYGGRWNSPGTSMVYAAQSLSLAVLEVLVHLEAEGVLARYWVYLPLDIADGDVLSVEDYAGVPDDFATWPAPASTRRIGDRWAVQAASVALLVPSAITPGERDVLLNPAHPDFGTAVSVGSTHPLRFDSRLVKRAGE